MIGKSMPFDVQFVSCHLRIILCCFSSLYKHIFPLLPIPLNFPVISNEFYCAGNSCISPFRFIERFSINVECYIMPMSSHLSHYPSVLHQRKLKMNDFPIVFVFMSQIELSMFQCMFKFKP